MTEEEADSSNQGLCSDQENILEDDDVSISIEKMLECTFQPSSEFSIFRVPDRLRSVNAVAYEPQMLAIGPYHQFKANLESMQGHKIHFLRQLLKRTGHHVSKYVSAMKKLQLSARKCYQGLDNYPGTEDNFVEMLVLDACFVVELIRKVSFGQIEAKDALFLVTPNLANILRDLLLVENQLPFFVLLELFDLTKMPTDPDYELKYTTSNLFLQDHVIAMNNNARLFDDGNLKEKHLLDIQHDIFRPSYPAADMKRRYISITGYGIRFIPCATKLKEAGITLKKIDKGRGMFDIRFLNGKLEFETLIVDSDTECLLQNLIAYEQVGMDSDDHYVTDYVLFMHSLISSTGDAELFSSLGIIRNQLGEDKLIPELFYKLSMHVISPPCILFYSDVIDNVNKYASRKRARCIVKWNRWMEKFWQEYFNSPWALISFMAACILLILTLIQTVYAVKSYY